jgi:hypothetical protein
MFKKIVLVIVILVAAVLIFAATKPDSFRVERTATINAPPAKIFPLINDFHSWGSWSPWESRDPAMKRTYGGAASGKGAVYEWDGNSQVGKGRMEITDTTVPTKVVIKLDFMKPLEGHDIAEYTLEARGDSTKVTWAMHGPTNFVGKLIGVFISMDKMIGKDFETGLANLKIQAEK